MFACSVSLLNPHAILDTIGVIGTNSLHYEGEDQWIFTITCILVSVAWFHGLAIAGRLMGSLDPSGVAWTTKPVLRSLNLERSSIYGLEFLS